MEDLFKDRYRISSARLVGWDYATDAYYFITMCTYQRIHHFGNVSMDDDHEYSVALSDVGEIVRDYWIDIPNHFSNVVLDEWIIMPNHVHGIIAIDNSLMNDEPTSSTSVRIGRDEALPRLSTDEAMPRLYGDGNYRTYAGEYPHMSKISPKPKSLPVIIGSFKSIVTKTANKQYPNAHFAWQPRFYDHIIRDERALYNIREYIKNNPAMWHRDRNNAEHAWM